MQETITLIIAIAGLMVATVTWVEAYRQGSNAVRPVLVVIEKLTSNREPKRGHSLFLVNLGQAVAIDARIDKEDLDALREHMLGVGGALPERPQSEIAANRKGELASGYGMPCLGNLSLVVRYNDVNKREYTTTYKGETRRHKFETQRAMFTGQIT